jgi:hypothetical protein
MLKIFYGVENNYADVTDKFLTYCFYLKKQKYTEAIIPKTDNARSIIFGDPIIGRLKKIIINYKKETIVLPHNVECRISISMLDIKDINEVLNKNIKVAVLTGLITNNKNLSYCNYLPTFDGADYFFFSNQECYKEKIHKNTIFLDSSKYKHLVPKPETDKYYNRILSKVPKIIPHKILPDYDYYIWHDYTHFVIKPPQFIISEYLKDNDFCGFYPGRAGYNVDRDLSAVWNFGRDDKELLRKTKERLNMIKSENKNRKELYFAFAGLIRKNNKNANTFCEEWFNYINTLTSRDQITFYITLNTTKIDLKINQMKKYIYKNDIITQVLPEFSRV